MLKTERLLLRPLVLTDLDSETEMARDPDVMKYIGKTRTSEQTARMMPKYVRRCAEGKIGIWCVTDLATEERLGNAILLPLPIEDDDTDWGLVVGDEIPEAEIEVGYMFKKSAWGKGYGTECCARLLKFAFEETPLMEVVAVTDPENQASQSVLEKSGMTLAGMRRAYAAQCTDFRITRQQWHEQNRKFS